MYGISKARRLKLQTHNASLRKQQEDGSGVESKTTAATSIDVIESIPSVPTMEQLPYMDIEYIKTIERTRKKNDFNTFISTTLQACLWYYVVKFIPSRQVRPS